MPLGALLVELGYLKETDLRLALALQKEHPGARIGALLVENHFIGEDRLVEVLSIQLGYERLDPLNATLEPQLLQVAPAKWLRSTDLIPVWRREGAVVVAFADPLNAKHLEAARRVFGANLVVGIAPASEIYEAIDRAESKKNRTPFVVNENVVVQTVNQMEDAIYKGLMGLTTYDEIIRQIPRLSRPRPVSEIRRLLGEVQ